MKKLLQLSFFTFLGFSSQAQIVNIPDANFKAYLLSVPAINTNSDAEIQVSEASAYTSFLDCYNKNIADFTGIEAFPLIDIIDLSLNQATTLNLSANNALTTVYCADNQFTSIALPTSAPLSTFVCYGNQLTSLDFSSFPNLVYLDCQSNQLTSLNVKNGNNTILTTFAANSNPNLLCIEVDNVIFSETNWTLIDATASFSTDCSGPVCNVIISDANFKTYLLGNSSINTNNDSEIQCEEAIAFSGTLNCSNLGITTLSGISSFTNIVAMNCSYNSLTNLDVSENLALVNLNCQSNQLSSLNVSVNINLTDLNCSSNSLTSLSLNGNNLIHLNCADNDLATLNLVSNTNLMSLDCSNNSLTQLNVANTAALEEINCQNNQLVALDLSLLPSITSFNCSSNTLNSLSIANGNNDAIVYFSALNNPSLDCIEVDDAVYSTTNWTSKDVTTVYSENCSTIGQTELLGSTLTVYPNPTSSQLTVELNEADTFQLVSLFGEILGTYSFNAGSSKIELSDLSAGIYFLQSTHSKSTKIIKE